MLLRSLRLTVSFLMAFGFLYPLVSHAAPPRLKSSDDAGRFVLQYVEALTHSNIEGWAAADLGCLSRMRGTSGGGSTRLTVETARRCWDETLHGHTAMVSYRAESGVFSATERSLGLLHDRHRATENWKEYPPAVFVSPPIILKDHASNLQTTVIRVSPSQTFALSNIREGSLVSVSGQAVDLKIVYPDPFTAPLALKPEEVWWVNGAQRHFGPVHEVAARFIVVTGLRKFGFSTDRAVMNEVLPGVPLIATTHYGLRPDNGRKFEPSEPAHGILKGELVPGSPRWWERPEAEPVMQATIDRAMHLTAPERAGLLARILLIDPNHIDAHTLRGEDTYQAFLRQGMIKGGLAARDEAALQRIAELYWTIQAQTWRQELTAVPEGHGPVTEALYQSLASYEVLEQQHHATPEQRRRLGTLTRWNNDPKGALGIHEALLHDTTPETIAYGKILTEIAWDRIQLVSWERRYTHPWLQQADAEAEEAIALLTQPYDSIHAHYAQVAVESLLAERRLDRFQRRMQQVKHDLDLIPGVKGLPGQLIANDLVKSLTPEAAAIVLPSPSRSPEVLDIAVHSHPPKQNILWQWNFDHDEPGRLPVGFVPLNRSEREEAVWHVQIAPDTAGGLHGVVRSSACQTADCLRLLVADGVKTTYPDVTVQVRMPSQSEAGIAIAVTDSTNYYSVTLQNTTGLITTRRVIDGVETMLGQVVTKLSPSSWHTIRVQRINFLHLDKGRLAVYIDGAQVAAVDDVILPREGQVGLIARGSSDAEFDSLHILDLVSNRTFSRPAAY